MAEQRLNPSPKQRFLKIKGAIGAHRNMVDSDVFERSVDFAEAEYFYRLAELAPKDISASSSEQAAAACFQRMLGVREFIRTLRSLSETPTVQLKQESTDNLIHKI